MCMHNRIDIYIHIYFARRHQVQKMQTHFGAKNSAANHVNWPKLSRLIEPTPRPHSACRKLHAMSHTLSLPSR